MPGKEHEDYETEDHINVLEACLETCKTVPKISSITF